jgi:hypothetical protein
MHWALCPVEREPGTSSVGGWVGHRVGLDALEKRKTLVTADITVACNKKI